MQASPRSSFADPETLECFRRDLGDLWPRVAPYISPSTEPDVLMQQLHERTVTDGTPLAGDLEALVAGWSHYDATQRAVLAGAVSFIAEPPEPADELVVSAAVRAVMRHR